LYRICGKEKLTETSFRLVVEAPQIARKRQPGQFVVIRVEEKGERFPLTIVDSDPEAGTIELIVQAAGYSTNRLVEKNVGEKILDLLGPLGEPTEIENFGRVVCVAGGVGAAIIYPVARALKAAGNEVITLLGARSEKFLILEEELEETSDRLIISTDDGSKGRSGFGSDILEELLDAGENIDRVFAVGPVVMMRAVAEVTRPYGVKTIVSLNPIMVDGTGMCGGCRVTVDGEVKFACMDGPEFDGHKVDFAELMSRQSFYQEHEECHLQNLSGAD
jgi:ferredoxin--NADP+ reductase